MHADAAPFAPSFLDTLFSAKEAIISGNPIAQRRKPPPLATLSSKAGDVLSIVRVCERLSLLVQLELPCTILITNPPLHLRHTVIRTVHLEVDNLVVHGDGFNLHLLGPNFHTARLVNHSDAEEGGTSLDICHADGMLYASIQPAPDGKGAAIWRDVMENPTLCLA